MSQRVKLISEHLRCPRILSQARPLGPLARPAPAALARALGRLPAPQTFGRAPSGAPKIRKNSVFFSEVFFPNFRKNADFQNFRIRKFFSGKKRYASHNLTLMRNRHFATFYQHEMVCHILPGLGNWTKFFATKKRNLSF